MIFYQKHVLIFWICFIKLYVYIFRNGVQLEYGGGREATTIVPWVIDKSGPVSKTLECGDLKEKIANSDFTFAFFGSQSEPFYKDVHEYYGLYEHEVSVVHNDDPECAKEFGVETPSEVFFRHFEQEMLVYDGAPNHEAMAEWAKPHRVVSYFEYTSEWN